MTSGIIRGSDSNVGYPTLDDSVEFHMNVYKNSICHIISAPKKKNGLGMNPLSAQGTDNSFSHEATICNAI